MCTGGEGMFSIDALYEEHNEQIYQFIYFLTFNETIAEDLLQETFIKAYEARHTFRGDSTALTWLRKIAKNLVIDHFKSKKKIFWQRYASLDDVEIPTPTTEELATVNEQKRELYTAIASLKVEYRLAIILRKIEGLSIKQTADILDWNELKVKNATDRGMQALEKIMKGGNQDGGTISKINSKASNKGTSTAKSSTY